MSESALSIVLAGAALGHLTCEYFSIDRKCTGRASYEKYSELQRAVLKVFLPVLPFVALPIFRLWKGDIFEYAEDGQTFMNLFLAALLAGPAIVYAMFGNIKAALSGLGIRILMVAAIIYLDG